MFILKQKVVIGLFVMFLAISTALATSIYTVHGEKKELEKEKEDLSNQLDSLETEKETIEESLEIKSEEVKEEKGKAEKLNKEKKKLDKKVKEKEEIIIKKDKEIKQMKAPRRQISNESISSKKGKTMTMEATAYTDNVASQGKWVGQTATGVKPQVGVIAVDPKVIPLGTKLIVEGYNNNQPVTAGDTGGAIKGNIIDVFLNTEEEVYNWGRKQVKVTILE